MPVQADLLCKTYHEFRSEWYANKYNVWKPLIRWIINNLKCISYQWIKKIKKSSTEDMGPATLKGNDIARLMNKDELAFLHMHHRSYISKSHLSEAERSWNHHHGPVLLNINTRGGGREGYSHAVATACSSFCFLWPPLIRRTLIPEITNRSRCISPSDQHALWN